MPNSRIIKQKIESTRPIRMARTYGLKEFYNKRNKILIVRGCGGLGDILMHRMIFEDIKILMPDAEIHFACPKLYHDAVRDHPFVDKVLDVDEVDRHEYMISCNTTSACGRYEMRIAPLSGDHRSDIWANHCGLKLTKHDMHFRISDEEKIEGLRLINEQRDCDGPSVLIAPTSAMINKNLLDHHIDDLFKELKSRGCFPFALHKNLIPTCVKNSFPTVVKPDLRQWLSIINQADYVISVDTSVFHAAGGMNKPLVGIFSFVDGKVYGKYFDFWLVQKHREDDPEWTCGPCYNWCDCPKTKNSPKPCITQISTDMILEKVDLMMQKHR